MNGTFGWGGGGGRNLDSKTYLKLGFQHYYKTFKLLSSALGLHDFFNYSQTKWGTLNKLGPLSFHGTTSIKPL